MKIAFRLDASSKVGMGHLMRCLTLANALKKRKAECVFFVGTDMSARVADVVGSFKLIEIPVFVDEAKDAEIFLNCMKGLAFDWIVVDHYSLTAKWEEKIPGKTFVIDDLADRKHFCEGLLDQSFFRKADDYKNLLLKSSSLFLGKDYILLNESFVEKRAEAEARRAAMRELKKVLISFGGVDSKSMTLFSLKALDEVSFALDVTVTVSAVHTQRAELEKVAKASKHHVTIIPDANNMAELILEADVCIGASGITSWERCFLGAPSLAIAVADNQKGIAEELGKLMCHHYLGFYNEVSVAMISDALEQLANDLELRKQYSKNSMNFLKESGADKLAKYLMGAE